MTYRFETDAVILKRKKSGTSGVTLHCFSPDFGLLPVHHAGFSSSRGSLQGILDIGHVVHIQFRRFEDQAYLEKARLIDHFDVTDYEALTLASMVFEIYLSWPKAEGHTPHPLFYRLLLSFLDNLEHPRGRYNALLHLQLHLLEALGIGVPVTLCDACRRPFREEETSFAKVNRWQFHCGACLSGESSGLALSGRDRLTLASWSREDYVPGKSHSLNRKTVYRIQQQMNAILSEYFTLQTLPEVMRLCRERLASNAS